MNDCSDGVNLEGVCLCLCYLVLKGFFSELSSLITAPGPPYAFSWSTNEPPGHASRRRVSKSVMRVSEGII